jgi:hypothetical protein
MDQVELLAQLLPVEHHPLLVARAAASALAVPPRHLDPL